MNEKFCPAPWTYTVKDGVAYLGSKGRRYPWSDFATVIVRMDGDDEDSPEGRGNLNLILAAPDMYEFIDSLPYGGLTDKQIVEKDRILAKALGNGPDAARMRALSKLTDEEKKAMIGYTGL